MTTELHSLPTYAGATHRRKIVGRGRSSGHGKTSTRGHKGQKSRTGFRQRPGFESGHIPLYRRLPRRGFNNAKFKAQYEEVNVGALSVFAAGTVVDQAALLKAGLIRPAGTLVKLLGAGEVKVALTVQVHAASASAQAKIEKVGGTLKTLLVKAEKTTKPTKEEKKASYQKNKKA